MADQSILIHIVHIFDLIEADLVARDLCLASDILFGKAYFCLLIAVFCIDRDVHGLIIIVLKFHVVDRIVNEVSLRRCDLLDVILAAVDRGVAINGLLYRIGHGLGCRING